MVGFLNHISPVIPVDSVFTNTGLNKNSAWGAEAVDRVIGRFSGGKRFLLVKLAVRDENFCGS